MTFTADKIITDDEIAPAIPVLNFWLNKTYPTYAGRYSASGMVGYNRLIALMIAKMTGQGHFPTGVTLPRNAKQASIDKAVELLKSTSYPEAGSFINASAGMLNDVPGGVLLNLIEQGAMIGEPATGGGGVDWIAYQRTVGLAATFSLNHIEAIEKAADALRDSLVAIRELEPKP